MVQPLRVATINMNSVFSTLSHVSMCQCYLAESHWTMTKDRPSGCD